MENQRIILFFALSVVLLLLWQAWQNDYGSKPEPQPSTMASASTPATTPVMADLPQTPPQASSIAAAVGTTPSDTTVVTDSKRIRVLTDVLDLEIDTRGGDIRRVDLRNYPVAVNTPDKPFRLLQDQVKVLIAQSGLISSQGAPDHYALFTATQDAYQLSPDAKTLSVPLQWQGADGVVVTKTYVFHRNSYLVEMSQQIENHSAVAWQGNQYLQLQRSRPGDDEKSMFISTYTGGVIYSDQEKYEKVNFDDMAEKDLSRDIKSGWAAMIQHYFLSAWIPSAGDTYHYYSKAPDGHPFVLGMVSAPQTISAGDQYIYSSKFYVGPKDQERLGEVAEGLKLTVDYGMLTVISQPLFWLLTHINKLLGNWGWSIIVLTLIIKLAFYKLSEKSYKSMANMRKMTPKIAQIRERYSDDRQRMSHAMMELYKQEKINPLGGCLPILVQIPVFIALYWVLLESVELRQAPFIGWINDLSTKDPYYILPLLMGITMYIQQKLNPPPPDPIQAKVLMALPFVFTFFFAFFPSGLVLYWVANSVLSIAQQWMITRRVEKEAAAA
ncbi:MAG: membrane protein insertase YidC [Gammaproteobacteria bacterium]|nr:membrane protein insertase YidC [Gammaproteobacteria bacterium]